MVNLTLTELRLIAGRIGIEDYENMSREKLLKTLLMNQSAIFKIYYKTN